MRLSRVVVCAVVLLAPAGAATAADKPVLVGFHAAPGPADVQLVESLGGRVTYRYKYIPVLAATLPEEQVSTLASNPAVAYVEDDAPLAPLGGRRQTTDYGVSKIEAPAAWTLGYRGDGVKVGIFDSGIDLEHPDLAAAIDGGVDLVGDGHGLDDCNGHGTHVAGIVGARDNGKGTVGVAPRVRLYSMRFADCAWAGATRSKEIRGLEWAIDNGMQVINMSFGATVPVPSASEEAALDAAYARGIVLVAASGNSSVPAVGFPAGYESVIAVGATDEQDQLATFSQWGEDQELTAPGVQNLSAVPVGFGQTTDLTVDTDNDRVLDAIALEFAGLTHKRGITADTIYAGFGTSVEFAGIDCTGRTALITRGGTTFADKATQAKNAGCVVAIIHNNQPGNFNGTLGAAGDWIPVVSISLDEGLYLKDQIQTKPTTTTLLNVVGDYAIFSGTSMASPHAAGVAALVVGKGPSLTPDDVRRILRESADDRGAPGWDPVFGYGRVNARRAVER
jgi:subtilisin family serine protease